MGRSPGRMAVVTGSRRVHTPCSGLAMHAFLVDLDGMLELDVQIGKKILVLVAGAARRGQIRGVHHGFRIRMGQDVVAAMAFLAGGNIRGLTDDASAVLGIDRDGFIMTFTAIGLGQRHCVGNPLDITMAVGTRKIFMDAASKIGCRNFRRDPARIGVTIRTDLIGEIPGEGKRGHGSQNEKKHGNVNPGSRHFLETFPWSPVAVNREQKQAFRW